MFLAERDPLRSIPATHPAVIGAAELYHHESVLRTSLGGAVVPPWLDTFATTFDQIRQSVKRIEQESKAYECGYRET